MIIDSVPVLTHINPVGSYFAHEQWFELYRITKVRTIEFKPKKLYGIRIVNSYGKIVDIYEDGSRCEVSSGKKKGI